MKLKEMRHNLGPHLIVMPLSVITSWRTDLQKFGMDLFDIYVHHEGKDNRHAAFAQWHQQLRHNARNGSQRKVSLFLTTYEIAIKDDTILSKLSHGSVQWQYLVVSYPFRHDTEYVSIALTVPITLNAPPT
jgi:chromodomain-helicase-DNA-binding protein 1